MAATFATPTFSLSSPEFDEAPLPLPPCPCPGVPPPPPPTCRFQPFTFFLLGEPCPPSTNGNSITHTGEQSHIETFVTRGELQGGASASATDGTELC